MSTSGESKVSDFGISRFVDNTVAQCQTFTGTVTYMSPERISGGQYGFPCDIWALGLTLLECATGRYPYNASGGTLELMVQVRGWLCVQGGMRNLSAHCCGDRCSRKVAI
jgi:serine/threonine protein kinase